MHSGAEKKITLPDGPFDLMMIQVARQDMQPSLDRLAASLRHLRAGGDVAFHVRRRAQHMGHEQRFYPHVNGEESNQPLNHLTVIPFQAELVGAGVTAAVHRSPLTFNPTSSPCRRIFRSCSLTSSAGGIGSSAKPMS